MTTGIILGIAIGIIIALAWDWERRSRDKGR